MTCDLRYYNAMTATTKVCIIFSTARNVKIIRSDAMERARVIAVLSDQPEVFEWRDDLARFISAHVHSGVRVYAFETDMPDVDDAAIKEIVEDGMDDLLSIINSGGLDDYGIKKLC